MKNPSWQTDELILALDVYFALGRTAPRDTDLPVIELSRLLNVLWQSELKYTQTLRNINGVRMKIMNFMRLDPEYIQNGRVGLSRGSRLEKVIWQEYADDPIRLSSVAQAIRSSIEDKTLLGECTTAPFYEEIEASEGKLLTRLHVIRERSPKLVHARKMQHLAKHGKLTCEVCGFNFYAT